MVDLAQQAGGEQTLHRPIRRRPRRGVAGATHRRTVQQPVQQVTLGRVERFEQRGELGGIGDGILQHDLAGVPGQARGGLGDHPDRRGVAPRQRPVAQVVQGGVDGVLGGPIADERDELADGDRRGVGLQHQQRVEHRQMQKVQVIGGGLDRLARLRARRERRNAARRRLGEVRSPLQQPDQPLVGRVGQPDAQRHAWGVFGHRDQGKAATMTHEDSMTCHNDTRG